MKIILNAQKLRDTLAIAARAIMGKPTMPVLSCLLLEADKEAQRLYITSTNLDLAIRASMPAEVPGDFALALNASMLVSIASKVDGETITIDQPGAAPTVKITSGNASFRLHGIGKQEFPPLQIKDAGAPLEIPQDVFERQLSSVACAVSTDEARYILNGVYIKTDGAGRTMVATDGRRLNIFKEAGDYAKASAILPSHTVQKLLPLLKRGQTCLWVSETAVTVKIDREDGEILVISKVVSGSFPNYQQVIPSREVFFRIGAAAFASAVTRVAMVTSEKSGSVQLKIAAGQITLSASSPDFGEATDTLTLALPEGLEGNVAFNYRYLLDAIEAAGADEIEVSLNPGDMSIGPAVIRAGGFLAVVMPVRLQ